MATYTFVTSLGVLKLSEDNVSRSFSDLGITIIDRIGPYHIASMELHSIPMEYITQKDLEKCYIVHNGLILQCSEDNNLNMHVHNVHRAYHSINSCILCFDRYPRLCLEGKYQPFYISTSTCITNNSIMEVYNLNKKDDYEFIINPSETFIKHIKEKSNICLTDKHGWIIIDGKNEIKY
ncbi:hypothetical protein [Swinepox virus]|uniref:Uncharacterized protein n=1 Tax=Swinepox virus TaxID=10276 RepID=A0A881SY66_SWPV|nr:hypothetical protein [Swinepox virus]